MYSIHIRKVTGDVVKGINVGGYRRGNQKIENPEKLITKGTQHEEKSNKNTT
jgi:hypothetical protein